MSDAQRQAHARSLRDPRGFWAEAAEDIEWLRRSRAVIDETRAPRVAWFPGAMLNTCSNALDLHVLAGRGEQAALVWDSPVTGELRRTTYRELQERVARFAGALAGLGVEPGDRVLLFLPMLPEAVIGMLATARLGAVHFMVSDACSAGELAQCIQQAAPKVVLAASCATLPGGVVPLAPQLERAFEMTSQRPRHCVVLQRAQAPASLVAGRDVDWREAEARAEPAACVPVEAKAPLYILQTAGTTGTPKTIVRDGGGHAVALKWSLRRVFGIAPGEVFWAASDLASGVGHSYAVYAPLLLGCTTILYAGEPVGTPDAGAFWRVVEQHRVNAMLAAPAALRAIRREDPGARRLEGRDLACLRALFLAGERADSESVSWAERALRVPVIEAWWQAETSLPIAASCVGLGPARVRRGSVGRPVPGFDVRVLGDDGEELPRGASGHLVLKLPLPPGCTTALWQNDEGFARSYLARFPGFYETGDGGSLDEEGQVFVLGRTHDVIEVAGQRVFAGAIEEVLAAHPDVAECAVIGMSDTRKGHLLLAFVVLERGVARDAPALEAELVARVRERIGAVAALERICVVEKLPKTRAGSVPRSTLRKIADGEPWRTPAGLEDPSALAALRAALARLAPRS